MTEKTLKLVRELLRADETIDGITRRTLLARLRNGDTSTKASSTPAPPPSIVRPKQAALRLGRSTRAVHRLCQEGLLTKVRFKGRARCAGITEESLTALLASSGNGGAQ